MKLTLRMVTLFVVTSLLLAGCFPAADSASAPQQVQATATLDRSGQVGIELTARFDTAAVYNTVNQIVRFTYVVKMVRNDLTEALPANVSISGIAATCPAVTSIGNQNDRFDAGESLECVGDYLLTQADLDRGSVTNTATAIVYSVNSNTVNTTVPTVPARALTLTRTSNPSTYSAANQDIVFTYTLKNSGSSPLGPAQFTVTDSGINNNSPFNCGGATETIAPGATLNCTATYKVTANDMNAASITTNATVAGGGANPSQPVSITVAKSAATPVPSTGTRQHTVRKGEWLWQIARCYGADPQATVAANTQLGNSAQLKEGMIVNIPNAGSKGTVHAPPELCVALHIVQSGDTWASIAQKYNADAGFTQYVNASTLTVGAEIKVPLYTAGMNYPVSGTAPTASPSQTALALTVSANPATYSASGETIALNYVIKNNGTTMIGPTQFSVSDTLINGNTPFLCGAANTSLAPGATTACSMNYTTSATDATAASVINKATASGGGVQSAAATVTINRTVTQVNLSVTANPATYNAAGQTIAYIYVIKNNGTTTLGPAQFTVTDTLFGSAPMNCGPANTTLAPSATVTCTFNYVTTQNDMNATAIQNSASASGGGASTTQPVSANVTKQ